MTSPRISAVAALAGGLSAGALGACQLLFPTVAAQADAGVSDGRAPDAGDGATQPEAAKEASGPYHALDAGWTTYPVALAGTYQGGVFDGRYVYMAPDISGSRVQRYDTSGPFTSSTSWSSFDTGTVDDAGVRGFGGAVFDGHNVYFVGSGPKPPPTNPTVFMRYDGVDFESPSSWQSFSGALISPLAQGPSGGTFDGRYLYFAPYWSGYVLQYDTKQSFTATTSWAGFDLTTFGPKGAGFDGALYDGRYVYLMPDGYFTDGGTQLCNSLFVRYDPKLPFISASAWKTYDLEAVDPNACGFLGGACDGRFLYLASHRNSNGLVLRYDTQAAALDAKSSWETFNTQRVDPSIGGFFSGAFDGRYVYMVPNENAVENPGGILARYDITGNFGDPASWGTYDLSQLTPAAVGFGGAVFDGEYLYFVPDTYPTVARFPARSPRLMPKLPAFFGSFY